MFLMILTPAALLLLCSLVFYWLLVPALTDNVIIKWTFCMTFHVIQVTRLSVGPAIRGRLNMAVAACFGHWLNFEPFTVETVRLIRFCHSFSTSVLMRFEIGVGWKNRLCPFSIAYFVVKMRLGIEKAWRFHPMVCFPLASAFFSFCLSSFLLYHPEFVFEEKAMSSKSSLSNQDFPRIDYLLLSYWFEFEVLLVLNADWRSHSCPTHKPTYPLEEVRKNMRIKQEPWWI